MWCFIKHLFTYMLISWDFKDSNKHCIILLDSGTSHYGHLVTRKWLPARHWWQNRGAKGLQPPIRVQFVCYDTCIASPPSPPPPIISMFHLLCCKGHRHLIARDTSLQGTVHFDALLFYLNFEQSTPQLSLLVPMVLFIKVFQWPLYMCFCWSIVIYIHVHVWW